MKTEILIYGLERGESRDYMETLLASNCRNAADIERVKEAASAAGFHSFRVATYDGLPPNFAAAVIAYLEDHTSVVGVTPSGIVYAQF